MIKKKSGVYEKPITYDQYIEELSEADKKWFSDYEQSIIEFYNAIDSLSILNKTFTQANTKRLVKTAHIENQYGIISNNIRNIDLLIRNLKSTGKKDRKIIKKSIKIVEKHDISTDNLNEKALCMSIFMYFYWLEYIRKLFDVFIDLDGIGISKKNIPGLGSWIKCLQTNEKIDIKSKSILKDNLYLNTLNTRRRNSIAHFNFYLQNNEIYFLSELFEKTPKGISYSDFATEQHQQNILSVTTYLIYSKQYIKNETITLLSNKS